MTYSKLVKSLAVGLSLFFLWSSSAFACDLTVSGAGTPAVNQTYTISGTCNSMSRYVGDSDNTQAIYSWAGDPTNWFMGPEAGSCVPTVNYYRAPIADVTSGWTHSGGDTGNDPSPSVTLCGGGGSGTTSLSSLGLWGDIASTSQNLIIDSGFPFWELALAFCMAFFLLFIILVGFAKPIKRLLRGR